ncbi:protein translocase subunit SecD [Natronogracilivirga saccharolytica]|uniref:Protein translocase subunit SecD n=1 Tax=Natronogracilivirga saccharolytica TaxID=2812953 RepID=A0A8J7UTI2_9BACT|nr:protein translocase subunit SecD [Natronogracilivirga saccharolytica]MBP3191360.1 protein translocase subunit SecD [Natronogracilivirga saccharolytica]
MKGNGTKLAFIVAFLAMTIYYLFPSFQYWLEMRNIDNMPEEERIVYLEENEARIEGMREKILTLGLDLQGGMHVTLELATNQLMRELASEYADDEFDDVMSVAYQRSRDNNSDVINEFVEAFEERDPNARLSRYFRSDADNITRRSSNSEIQEWLQEQRDAAVNRAIEIVRNRVDRFGVTEPSIVRQGSNRLVVELPGVTDEERVRDLLRGTARLEFRLTADPDDLRHSLEQIIAHFDPQQDEDDIDLEDEFTDMDQEEQDNPLLQVLMPQGQGVNFGSAAGRDTARVNELIKQEDVQRLLPRDIELMWTANPQFESEGRGYYTLIGVRRQVELTGDVITEARPTFDQHTNQPEVSMNMDRQGARTWARVTGANIGRPIAIALDGVIYSYPVVQGQITGGRSSITGLASSAEAEDLVNILMSGALPAPLDIVQERTVGPSLGEASIRAGFNSAMIGLMIVVVFMMVYYRAGGAIADIALVLNIIFIMGILAAFNATLTLPGIAGIVLTIGMAVDANVLIFDRIREELRAGKSLIAAIDSGYSNSMSAILDANITTFLTAVILFSFGVGPIKGFAITLMAGIAASLFSAIIITRVIVDWMTKDKKWNISYG